AEIVVRGGFGVSGRRGARACSGRAADRRALKHVPVEWTHTAVIAGHSALKTRVNALLTRQSIFFANVFLRRGMDPRVKSAFTRVFDALSPRVTTMGGAESRRAGHAVA